MSEPQSTPSVHAARYSHWAKQAFALLVGLTSVARVEAAPVCAEPITRSSVVRCAQEVSLLVRAEEHGVRSVDARRASASVILPSNPVLSVVGAYPVEPSLVRRPALWSATLSQELEVAGQRGARLRGNAAEAAAQRARLVLVRRDVAARTLVAFFELLAAKEAVKLAVRLGSLTDALRELAAERAKLGVGSELDAQLADAAAIRIEQSRLAAERRLGESNAALISHLGFSEKRVLETEGELTPLTLVDRRPKDWVKSALRQRPELALVAAERELQVSRVELYRRLRIPNPTLSLMARNDWIGERSIGIGLGFPIPLPAPIGRNYAGEIAEASALSDRAGAESLALRRVIELEVTMALERVEKGQRTAGLYTEERVQKTLDTLASITQELRAGRLPPRDALLSQQSLIDVLAGYVEARRALCVASVELAVASGLQLEEVVQ